MVDANSPIRPNLVQWTNDEDRALYERWANIYHAREFTRPINNYFDYFFSGQDIQIRIEGLSDDDILPIYQFGFNIQQNKQPIYGYWSYTFDYMMRGTRIVAGALTLVPKHPGYMTEMIARAAETRSAWLGAGNSYLDTLHPIRGLDIDETNINRYWRRNFDSNLLRNQQHLFSAHPPFNFIVTYGMQDTSLADFYTADTRAQSLRRRYSNSNALMSDTNERLVAADQDGSKMSLLIENVEIVSRQSEINADGDPILETYTFMARDIVEAPDYSPDAG